MPPPPAPGRRRSSALPAGPAPVTQNNAVRNPRAAFFYLWRGALLVPSGTLATKTPLFRGQVAVLPSLATKTGQFRGQVTIFKGLSTKLAFLVDKLGAGLTSVTPSSKTVIFKDAKPFWYLSSLFLAFFEDVVLANSRIYLLFIDYFYTFVTSNKDISHSCCNKIREIIKEAGLCPYRNSAQLWAIIPASYPFP